MVEYKAGKEADINEPSDRGEDIAVMEPLQLGDSSPHRESLTELAVDLAAKSAGFRRSLPDGVVSALADLVLFPAVDRNPPALSLRSSPAVNSYCR